jgi:hypothetical protein
VACISAQRTTRGCRRLPNTEEGDEMSKDATTSASDIITSENDVTDGLTPEELAAEEVTALPDKEVVSILDLNVDADIALDLAAPIDLAVAANANVAAPIDAAAAANVLSVGSSAQALADQGAMITQGIVGDASATATQVSDLDQSNDVVEPAPAPVPPVIEGDALSGDLLNVDVNLAADLDVAAPIAGAVAANANVAAPIDAAVAANIASVASSATAVADQDAIIEQSIEGDSTAVADQDSEINQ